MHVFFVTRGIFTVDADDFLFSFFLLFFTLSLGLTLRACAFLCTWRA